MQSDKTERPRDPETGRFLPTEDTTSGQDPAGDTGRRHPQAVFVTDPAGYPRPTGLYFPALPWLWLPPDRPGRAGPRPL